MSTALATRTEEPSEMRKLAEACARSGFFQDSRDAAQAFVKIKAGEELGIPAISSMAGIFIVKGKVTLSAVTMAGCVKRTGRYTYKVLEHTDKACEIQFSEYDAALKAWATIGTSRFTMEDAQKAGLTSNDTYRKFSKNMLFSRAMSNGVKWHCPDVFQGPVYTPEELDAPEPEAAVQPVNQRDRLLGAVADAPQLPAPEPAAPIEATLDELVDEEVADVAESEVGKVEPTPDEKFQIRLTEAMASRELPKRSLVKMKDKYKVKSLMDLDNDGRERVIKDIAAGQFDYTKGGK
jgi:hypothetical protein